MSAVVVGVDWSRFCSVEYWANGLYGSRREGREDTASARLESCASGRAKGAATQSGSVVLGKRVLRQWRARCRLLSNGLLWHRGAIRRMYSRFAGANVVLNGNE